MTIAEDTRIIGEIAPDVPFRVFPQKLIGSHVCITANAGAGKSGLIRVMLEQLYPDMQIIVLDPEDEYYTLRELHGFLIAGGEGGDCPATPDNAELLANSLLEHGMSAIVQLNDLKAGEQERFVRIFLETVMEAPRAWWRPLLIVLDEAHRFAPQDGNAESSGAVRDVTSRGRKRGYTMVLATQRMAKIEKNVTGDVNNWLLGRVGQLLDRKVAAQALGFTSGSKDGVGLQSMPTRQFWGFGVALTAVPTQFTVAEAQTTIIKAGQGRAPTPPTPKAMQAMVKALAAAAQKAADEKASAEKRVAPNARDDHTVFPRYTQDDLDAAYKRGDDNGRQIQACKILESIRPVLAELEEAAGIQVLTIPENLHLPDNYKAMLEPYVTDAEHVLHPGVIVEQPVEAKTHKIVKIGDRLSTDFSFKVPKAPKAPGAPNINGAVVLVKAAASVHPVRMSWSQIAQLADRKASGGHFNSSKKTAVDQGWMNETEAGIGVTQAGLEAIGFKGVELHVIDTWRNALPQPAQKMFDAINHFPGMTRDALAARLTMQPRGGHWNFGMATLMRNKLIIEKNGILAIAEWLRP